jgi:hypothetical protein
MGEYKTVGTTDEQQGNVQEVGAEIERVALQNVRLRERERPVGKPFTIESPKIYPHQERGAEIEVEARANAVARESGESRALGQPHIEAPPPSRAAIEQSAGKTYPPRKE